jgi:hypothetical protein
MGICWYCYWGWPKPVADIYKQALAKLDGNELPLQYGPAHVVWEDENFDYAEWCLEHFYECDYSEDDLDVVRWSLEELAKIPLNERCPKPEDYDDEHPDVYPPKAGTEMVRM